MLAIIDYDMGNVKSIQNAFNLLGEESKITDDHKQISESEAIILPGVGAFADGMKNLKRKNLISVLETEVLEKKKPYLGICLGLELLCKKSFEGGENNGLSWIDATVRRILPNDRSLKVPHVGWNDTEVLRTDGLLSSIEVPTFYFNHSYFVDVSPNSNSIITSTCSYGDTQITSSIEINNISAVQFHPEKSQSAGLHLLKNFIGNNLC